MYMNNEFYSRKQQKREQAKALIENANTKKSLETNMFSKHKKENENKSELRKKERIFLLLFVIVFYSVFQWFWLF